ncbi:receptor-like protein EIX2 [Senna tora]|uniref:Receptor-like protein EIX2 n=1 Tax=Senna tora TaxID=362788 RepID=A0A834WG11_9FABA|nr:receptor-like protein EIX2 [Senna tora]
MVSFFSSNISFVLSLLLCATTFNPCLCSNNNKVIRCDEKDRSALSVFKAGVLDSSNLLSSWSTEEDCCEWVGVQCDNLTGRVTMLDLQGFFLAGEINLSDLLQLESLNHLDLGHNVFTAISIPPNYTSKFEYLDLSYNTFGMESLQWISPLSSLKYLHLSGLNLSGETNWLHPMAMLPSLSNLIMSNCGLTNISSSLNYLNFSSSLVFLELSYNNFYSELPNWLFNLTSVMYVDLRGSHFYGEIPISLWRLRNLQSLYLLSNKLSGSVSYKLGQLEHLQLLDLSDNLLSGSIPSTLGNLSSLTYLDLSINHLSGHLPKSLGQLSNLESLNLKGNSLVGVITEETFSKLSSLDTLQLSSTGLGFDLDPKWVPPFQLSNLFLANVSLGPNFPTWLYTQKSLDSLDISSCGILSIDDEDMFWRLLGRIGNVDISNNSISGDLSEVTLNSTYINLDCNNFTGLLPHISSNVIFFSASHNSFSGSTFAFLCHTMSNEEHATQNLDLSDNLLTGELPDCWANWKQLFYLDLGNNKLTGEIPPSMATLSNLFFLDLQNNSFSGEFSINLLSISNLEYLILAENQFSGRLPNTMQPSLVTIQLRSNQFIGSIPPCICNLPSLMVLDLADNMLFGSIPHCIYNMTAMASDYENLHYVDINLIAKGKELRYAEHGRLRSIDLSYNSLSGEIPPELFSLILLWSLNLSRNHFLGKVPRQIGGLKSLECLDLSFNKLSGEIPQSISGLSFLSYLNLSYNNFIGQIPLGTQLQSFEASSFVGNPELCGAPLTKNCIREESKKPVLGKENNDDDDDEIFLKSLYLGMGVGFAIKFMWLYPSCSKDAIDEEWETQETPAKVTLLFQGNVLNPISMCSNNNKKVIRCNEKDRWVLSKFKAGVEDPYNRLFSWSNEEDCCAWIGVHCDNLTVAPFAPLKT